MDSLADLSVAEIKLSLCFFIAAYYFVWQVGIPMYGVSGIFSDIDDNRAHGRDERFGVREFYEGQEFLDKLVESLAGQKTTAIKK